MLLVFYLIMTASIYIGDVNCVYCYACSSFLATYCRDPFRYNKPLLLIECDDRAAFPGPILRAFANAANFPDETRVGFNPKRRRRSSDDLPMIESTTNRSNKTAIQQVVFTNTSLVRKKRQGNPMYGCFKMDYHGSYDQKETFRGCAPAGIYDICSLMINMSSNADSKIIFCDVCDGDDSPSKIPCNTAELPTFSTLTTVFGCVTSIIMSGSR